MNKNTKGFTLIELLVVIAIIGILAALVLVALGNARDKAQDVRIKSSMGQLRTLAEVIYDNGGSSYAGVGQCIMYGTGTGCSTAVAASAASLKADITAVGAGGMYAASAATTYCMHAPLKSPGAGIFCTDSTGVAKVIPSGAPTCSASQVVCP